MLVLPPSPRAAIKVRVVTRVLRGDPALEPMGCIGSLGWDCVRFALCVFDFELPLAVTCATLYAESACSVGERENFDRSSCGW